jgi:hypothetical protein
MIKANLIDKVGGFDRPAVWDLMLLNLHLLCEDSVSDFLSRLAVVGPL